MPDYSKSVIYKIYDNTNGDVYYGSTCNELRVRISKHKNDAKDDKKICKSKSIILNGDYTYSVVEKYPCETKLELHTRERWWVENNVCINKQIPSRTRKEWYADNADERKEKMKRYYIDNGDKLKNYQKQYGIKNADKVKETQKQYRIENADKLKEYRQQYRFANIDKIKEINKQYRNDNTNKIKEYNKEYYIENKDKINKKWNEKFTCECGGKFTLSNKIAHNKSQKHQKYINSIQTDTHINPTPHLDSQSIL